MSILGKWRVSLFLDLLSLPQPLNAWSLEGILKTCCLSRRGARLGDKGLEAKSSERGLRSWGLQQEEETPDIRVASPLISEGMSWGPGAESGWLCVALEGRAGPNV